MSWSLGEVSGSVWGKHCTVWGGSSTGKCSWYYFPVEKAAQREVQGWDYSVLCLLGWGAVITHIWIQLLCHIHGPQGVPHEQTKADPGAVGVPPWYLEISCSLTPLDGSTVLAFHSLPAGCKHPFLTTSYYLFLPHNFPAVCIQQERTFSCRKNKIKL